MTVKKRIWIAWYIQLVGAALISVNLFADIRWRKELFGVGVILTFVSLVVASPWQAKKPKE